MAMPAGCKYAPKEEVLVGIVLRKRVRGEPPDPAAADCIREADVYGHHPAQLTALFPPTNQGPHEWFFFSWCKVKGKRARCGGRDDHQEARRGDGFKRGRKERSVRDAGGAGIGQWRSTQAAKRVIQIDVSGCVVTIGYHQNFEFRDSKKQKTDWLMEEYGLLPSSGGAEAAGCDDKEQVICKIYKTPAARRAEAKQSVAPATLPPRVSLQLCPSQPELPQQRRPRLQPQLSPPPWPALPPLLPASSVPDVSQPQLSPTSWSVGTPLWPPQRELMVQPLISMQLDVPWHDSMMAARDRTPFCPLDRDRPDVPHGAVVYPELYEAVATYVGGGQMRTTSQIPQCTTTDVSDHHTYDGSVLFQHSDRQQQQQQQHTEPIASAAAQVEGSTTPDDQSAAVGAEGEAEKDLGAFLQSVPTEQPPVSSDHARYLDESLYMVHDGSLFAEMPTIDIGVDDYLISDGLDFLDI
ncbi:uncharacterized protein LOC109719270 [Ananas comosus]|uniref:Uncharacterized protein LOC109719270 n=1 Tax=Ananas comosus TaxID=4615 RepID=A0A6P5FZF2_ANACO|nr:uncharacterized protein LOC109719270 [Ananas comosus]